MAINEWIQVMIGRIFFSFMCLADFHAYLGNAAQMVKVTLGHQLYVYFGVTKCTSVLWCKNVPAMQNVYRLAGIVWNVPIPRCGYW